MSEINDRYQSIIKKCKFISKPNEWFIEGSEAKNIDRISYSDYKEGDKFNDGWSLFSGLTNETFQGYKGELPRQDEETCPFDEFFMYDEYGKEISKLTLYEYENQNKDEK